MIDFSYTQIAIIVCLVINFLGLLSDHKTPPEEVAVRMFIMRLTTFSSLVAALFACMKMGW